MKGQAEVTGKARHI